LSTSITRFDPATDPATGSATGAGWQILRTDRDASPWVAIAGDKVIYATTSYGPPPVFDPVGPCPDRIVALDLADGSEVWSYTIGDHVVAGVMPAAVFGDEIVFKVLVADSFTNQLVLVRLAADDGSETLRTVLPGVGVAAGSSAVAVGANG
jgi:outer membrane protein assembly factor BamB